MKTKSILGRAGIVSGLLGAGVVAACGGAVDSGTDEGKSEIINGTASNAAMTMGIVQVFHTNLNTYCSGTLLQNDVILTAKHCVTFDGTPSGTLDTTAANYTLVMGTETRTATSVLWDPNTDTAILLVGDFFPMNSQKFNWNRPIYPFADSSLQGVTLACYGYGSDAFNGCAGQGTCAGGNCTLHTANLKVASTTTSSLVFSANSSGQYLWHGDSGSTCFWNSYATGVFSRISQCGAGQVTQDTDVGPEAYRPWATGILNNYGHATTTWATAANTTGHFTDIDDA